MIDNVWHHYDSIPDAAEYLAGIVCAAKVRPGGAQ